jgi:hypothetical protein
MLFAYKKSEGAPVRRNSPIHLNEFSKTSVSRTRSSIPNARG